jgi:peptide/nickel transport system substrate-binding protein
MNFLSRILGLAFILIFGLVACKKSTNNSMPLNTVSVRLDAEPDRIHPLFSVTSVADQIEQQVFQALAEYDPVKMELYPVLATNLPKPSQSPNNPEQYVYDFEIRKEAKWDDGSPVTAYDYIFSLKAAFNPLSPSKTLRGLLYQIVDVTPDLQNVKRFSVTVANIDILNDYLTTNFKILPEYIYDPNQVLRSFTISDLRNPDTAKEISKTSQLLKDYSSVMMNEDFSRRLISGSGAYQLISWETGKSLILERKENWWADELHEESILLQAHPRQIAYYIVPDEVAVSSLIREGSLDIIGGLNAENFFSLKNEDKTSDNYQFINPPVSKTYYLSLNTKGKLINDVAVRKALSMLLDYDLINDNLMHGLGIRFEGPFHPSKSFYDSSLALSEFDLNGASELLNNAGWSDSDDDGILDKDINGQNIPLQLEYATSPGGIGEDIGLILKENAKKAGIEIDLDIRRFNLILPDLRRRDFDIVAMGRSTSPGLEDPYQNWHTGSDNPSGRNFSGFGNELTDSLIMEIRHNLDSEKQMEAYHAFQKEFVADQPIISLFAPPGYIAVKKGLELVSGTISPGYFVNTAQTSKKVPLAN